MATFSWTTKGIRNELHQRVVVEKKRPVMRELITNLWQHDPEKRYTAADTVKYIYIENIFPVEKRSVMRDKVAEYNNLVHRKDKDMPIIFQDLGTQDQEKKDEQTSVGADILVMRRIPSSRFA